MKKCGTIGESGALEGFVGFSKSFFDALPNRFFKDNFDLQVISILFCKF